MQLPIGNLTYSVVLVRGYVMDGRRRCLGLACFDTQTIYISDVPTPMGRLQTLVHEVMECWMHHVGFPGLTAGNKETVCDYVATAMSQLIMSIMQDPAAMTIRLMGRGSVVETNTPARARQTEVKADGETFRVTVVEPVE